jgi:hypothetical protein
MCVTVWDMLQLNRGADMGSPNTDAVNAGPSHVPASLDWEQLQRDLGTSSIEETQKRAYEIAKFVADVEKDADSELILRQGDKKLLLTLKR